MLFSGFALLSACVLTQPQKVRLVKVFAVGRHVIFLVKLVGDQTPRQFVHGKLTGQEDRPETQQCVTHPLPCDGLSGGTHRSQRSRSLIQGPLTTTALFG